MRRVPERAVVAGEAGMVVAEAAAGIEADKAAAGTGEAAEAVDVGAAIATSSGIFLFF
jgi:hypothetical protein